MFQLFRGQNRHQSTKPQVPDYRDSPVYHGQLDKALEYFADTLGLSDDYMVRVCQVAGHSAACLFIATICDQKAVEDTLQTIHDHKFPKKPPKNLAQYLVEQVLTGSDALFMTNMYELREAITDGSLVVLVDAVSPAIVMGAKSVEHRTPNQPFIEAAVRGSQISFVEDVDINVGLLRSSLNTDTLQIKKMRIGYRSRRQVAVVFLGDVANPTVVETVLKRLNAIHIDLVDQSAVIEHQIIEHKWSPFPQTRVTQRVDSTVREINQGKVVIIVDGDPNIMMVPATWQDFFQTEEDYSHSFYEATFTRWLRIISFILSAFLPALYIAFVDFNPELLPKTLGLQIAKSREGVPFPAVTEVTLMQIVVEILREATLRMPKQMGQTIGIVGGLVVGEASVQAGLVSNILIIVVALTAVSIFVTPSYEFAVVTRIGGWLMIASASILGLYGIILAAMWMMYEISAMKSFGISYADPFTGEHIKDVFLDSFIRAPITMTHRRTSHLHPIDDTGDRGYKDPMKHPIAEKRSTNWKLGRGRKP